MWSVALLVLACIGIFVGKAIGKTDAEELKEYGAVIVVLFALIVTIPMLIFSYGYIAYYLLNIMFGLNVTFWESLLIAFLIRILLKRD